MKNITLTRIKKKRKQQNLNVNVCNELYKNQLVFPAELKKKTNIITIFTLHSCRQPKFKLFKNWEKK